MTDLDFAEETLATLQERHPRFHRYAYAFLLDALHTVIGGMRETRHISGEELVHGVRDLAMERYGPLARTVLEYWGIHSTEDLGEVVFALVEIGILVKQDEDSPEDFEGLFDFVEVFDRNYPWTAAS
ncbi:MAG: hypothetical protein OEO23_00080 [Gemmatimonadota bacterium]|nr:hypothetical protein [Gemmatimonadota bacterium]